MSDLSMVALEEIELDEVNPRTNVNPDGIAQLAASIREHGVLQPVIVRPKDGGGYALLAGQRRFLAAREAQLDRIPAVVRDANGDARAITIVENLQREQLNPLEEAHAFRAAVEGGMSIGELAKAVSIGEQTIRDRLGLLELPADVHAHIGSGDLTLGAARALRELAFAGDAVLAKAAAMVAGVDEREGWGDQITVRELERDPSWVLDAVLDELQAEKPFIVRFNKGRVIGFSGYDAIDWPDGVDVAETQKKANELPQYDVESCKSRRSDALRISEEDIDAARAYGCLQELRSARGSELWVTDAEWLADRLAQKVDKALESYQRALKKRAKKAGATDVDEDARETRKAETAARRAQQISARERNVSLRIALTKQLHAPPVAVDGLRALGELLLQYAGDDIGRRWRFVDEASETVTTKKDGSISKISYARSASEQLRQDLRKASTVEEINGVLMRALVAIRFVDVAAAIASDQFGEVRGMGAWSPNTELVAAVERIAEPVLPADIVQALREKREAEQLERQEEREQIARDYRESDLPARVRAGEETCPACGNRSKHELDDDAAFEPCGCAAETIVAAVAECPRCGEMGCFAMCGAFQQVAEVAE